MSHKKKYFGVYQLPAEQQARMIEHDLWDIRHEGKWALEDEIKQWPEAIAVMKSHGLFWDTSIPRLLRTGYNFNIEPRMNYVLVVIYPSKKKPVIITEDSMIEEKRAVQVKSLGKSMISMARKKGIGDDDFVIVSIKRFGGNPIDFVKKKYREGGN